MMINETTATTMQPPSPKVSFNAKVTVHVLPKRHRYLSDVDVMTRWWSLDELDTILVQCLLQVEQIHEQQQQQLVDVSMDAAARKEQQKQLLAKFRGLEHAIHRQNKHETGDEMNRSVQCILEQQQINASDLVNDEYKKIVETSMERALIAAYYDEVIVREYLKPTKIEYKRFQQRQRAAVQESQSQSLVMAQDTKQNAVRLVTAQQPANNIPSAIRTRLSESIQRRKRRASVIRAVQSSPSGLSSLTLSEAINTPVPQSPASPPQKLLSVTSRSQPQALLAATIVSPLQHLTSKISKNRKYYECQRKQLRRKARNRSEERRVGRVYSGV